tara:strand:- start:271 stop:720 length:450 start_codon:yes stop_codon:yes gene_type:complete
MVKEGLSLGAGESTRGTEADQEDNLKIFTGFLTGNLCSDREPTPEEINDYAERCSIAIRYAFPGAEVSTTWQDGAGSEPIALQTRVESDAPDETKLEAATEFIDQICEEVWLLWAGDLAAVEEDFRRSDGNWERKTMDMLVQSIIEEGK